jgi:hypothetical protein
MATAERNVDIERIRRDLQRAKETARTRNRAVADADEFVHYIEQALAESDERIEEAAAVLRKAGILR